MPLNKMVLEFNGYLLSEEEAIELRKFLLSIGYISDETWPVIKTLNKKLGALYDQN